MTKRWKLKTNSSNILLVLITLILVKAEWANGELVNSLDYANSVESSKNENVRGQTSIYVGNDEIAEYFFSSPGNNGSVILAGINKCLDNFQLIICVKMLLLNKINDAMILLKEPKIGKEDMHFLNGLLVFKIKNETADAVPSDGNEVLNLDEEIAAKMRKMFWRRSLMVNLFPNVQIEIEPQPGKQSDFFNFRYTIRKELEPIEGDSHEVEGRGRKRKKKKKKGGGGMSMMMMVPQMLMMGLMPFTLASLKAMVMNAVMINMMALNGAIFMTIRNLVFGPRNGDNVMYVNYGYAKDKQPQTKRPVLIIHSPAAFVKQPPVPKKRNPGQQPSHRGSQNHGGNHYYGGSGSASENYVHETDAFSNHNDKHYVEAVEYDEDSFYVTQPGEDHYGHIRRTSWPRREVNFRNDGGSRLKRV